MIWCERFHGLVWFGLVWFGLVAITKDELVGVGVVTNRGDGLKVSKSRTMSTKFLQLFSLFSFTVDSQCFIAQDFFSISQIERGKRIAKHQFKADLAANQARKSQRESSERIEGKYRGKHRGKASGKPIHHFQEIYSIHARQSQASNGYHQCISNRCFLYQFYTAFPKHVKQKIFSLDLMRHQGEQASDSNKRLGARAVQVWTCERVLSQPMRDGTLQAFKRVFQSVTCWRC